MALAVGVIAESGNFDGWNYCRTPQCTAMHLYYSTLWSFVLAHGWKFGPCWI